MREKTYSSVNCCLVAAGEVGRLYDAAPGLALPSQGRAKGCCVVLSLWFRCLKTACLPLSLCGLRCSFSSGVLFSLSLNIFHLFWISSNVCAAYQRSPADSRTPVMAVSALYSWRDLELGQPAGTPHCPVCVSRAPRRPLPFHALRFRSDFTPTLGTLGAQCESTPHALLCVGRTAVPPHGLFWGGPRGTCTKYVLSVSKCWFLLLLLLLLLLLGRFYGYYHCCHYNDADGSKPATAGSVTSKEERVHHACVTCLVCRPVIIIIMDCSILRCPSPE